MRLLFIDDIQNLEEKVPDSFKHLFDYRRTLKYLEK